MNQPRASEKRAFVMTPARARGLLAIVLPFLLLGVAMWGLGRYLGAALRPPASATATPAPSPEAAPPLPARDAALIARQQMLSGLQTVLEQEASVIDGRVSIHVRLDDGGEAGIEPDRPVDGASVIKIPVMVALYDAWESGELKRTAADERRLRLMITRSKNIVTNELIERLGMARVNRCLTGNGYQCSSLRTMILKEGPAGPNLISAAEMTRMLRQIVHGELVSPKASAEMRKLLLAQHWRERIPAALPKEAVVGNKTGTMHNLLHDVAFVEAPTGLRYYIAVLIERGDRSRVRSDEIARLSRRVYDYLTTFPAQPTQPAEKERPMAGGGQIPPVPAVVSLSASSGSR
jgi:beta-lactamase class A